MKHFYLFLFLIVISVCNAYSQEIPKKSLVATRVDQAPKIDGVLDDIAWQNVPTATDFVEVDPQVNVPASQRTEVKVVYTDNAIYIGAMLYDTNPELILAQLTARDDQGNADLFGVYFDTYFDKQNLYRFAVTAAGVQLDEKENVDNFDAIWENSCKITDKGWIAEIKIPYFSIRFPEKDVQQWGIQFRRNIRRTRQDTYWQYVPNGTQNYPAFIGELTDITNIKPPLRLSATPYLGTTFTHFPSNVAGQSNWSRSYNAGLDIKYGINESFTLDATLAPDFGQVQSDNQVLNLSAFEVQFQENRPFFNEGVDLFSIGGLFYPRRIGKEPDGYGSLLQQADAGEVTIIDNPAQTQLINATKVSGRTADGLGLGLLNAVTAETQARVRDTLGNEKTIVTEPLTNFNIIAANQTLENNSSISFINTNVRRAGSTNTANVTGLGFTIGNKANSYEVEAFTAISQQRTLSAVNDGYTYSLFLGKTSGNFQFDLGRNVESDTYNPNDLGLLFSPNEINNNISLRYNTYEPKGIVLRTGGQVYAYRSSTYDKNLFQDAQINFNEWILLKNYLSFFLSGTVKPVENNDIFEARIPGLIYKGPAFYGANVGVSSDYRKAIALDAQFGRYYDFTRGGKFTEYKIGPLIRVNDKFSFKHTFSLAIDLRNQGWAAQDSIWTYFSRRNVRIYSNLFQGTYVFSPRSSISLRVRQYWSTVDVLHFDLLTASGKLISDTTGYNKNKDRSVNFFNVDFVYTWRFAPGSDLILVWKNAIVPDKNFVPAARSDIDAGLGKNVYRTLRDDQLNTFTLKVLYYLDYQYFKAKKRK